MSWHLGMSAGAVPAFWNIDVVLEVETTHGWATGQEGP